MITQLDGYFADQAGRTRTYAEQQADDARSAGFIASIARGRAALTRLLGRLPRSAASPAPQRRVSHLGSTRCGQRGSAMR